MNWNSIFPLFPHPCSRHTPHLRRLDVYQCDVSDVALSAVFAACAQLHVLWCGGGAGPITDRAFVALAAAPCRRVFEELHICTELYESADANSAAELDYRALPCAAFGTPAAVALRAQVLRELCSPAAAARLDVGDDGLVALAAHCPRLRVLNVTGLPRVTDATLGALARHAHHTLTSVTFDFCAAISLRGVQRLLLSCAQLRHVSLFGCAGLDADAGAALQRTLRCTISGQRLLCVRADVPEAGAAGSVWPCDAWHAQWNSREAKHLVLSGRRSFAWDLQEEANNDRCWL